VSLAGLVKLALDGMFAFSTAPLRFVFLLGAFVSTISLVVALGALYYRYVLGHSFLNWPYGLTTAFFFGGVQLIGIGIIGEYIGRIYEEVKQRPYYIARETIGFDSSNQVE
jgi:dolichol-phosphate mannosyltransferase